MWSQNVRTIRWQIRTALTGFTLLALATAGLTAACATGSTPDQARPGNIFEDGELVQIPVPAEGQEVSWRVIDFFGREVGRGTTLVAAGRALIEPGLDEPGYFEVAFTPAPGRGEQRRAFAIIMPPAPDDPSQPSPFGVMTHFAQGWERDLLPLITKAGIRYIRDEQYWSEVEPAPSAFDFPERFTAYMADAAARGLVPLIVMSFENSHYDDGLTPYTDAGRAAYARYGRAILERYGAQIQALEIWNEYNGSFVKGPASDDRVTQYTAMLKEAYRQIKAARPDVMVLGGAAVTVPLPWFETIFAQGGLDFMDGVVIHPYRSRAEGVEREIEALRELIASHNGGAPKPIWATEVGRFDNSERGRRETASYLVRMSTLLLSAGVERIYWYLMRDYHAGGSNFDSMGLVRAPDSAFGRYAPAPAYVAYATLIRLLKGATYVRRERSDPRTEVHLFRKQGEEVRVVWSTSDVPRLQFDTDGPLTLVDLMGGVRNLPAAGDGVSLLASENPIYVKGPVTQIREWRADALVADSNLDSSAQTHAGDWQYGQYNGDGQGTGDGAAPVGAYSDDDFEPLSRVDDLWGRSWGEPELGPVKVDGGGAHPGRAGERPVWAVRRWRSPFEGTIRIRGEIGRESEKGDGTEVHILKDGAPVFSKILPPATGTKATSYDLMVEVNRGTAIDFAVTPGPGQGVDYDNTTFSASISLPLIADSERDFSLGQGTNGWRYGYYDGGGEGADDGCSNAVFDELVPGDRWGAGALGPLAITPTGAHPGLRDGRPVCVVRRWVSGVEGPVRITGDLAIWQNTGDGVRGWILVDGKRVLKVDLGGPDRPDQTSYDVTATVQKGSAVDFGLDPGAGGNIDFDGSTFTARIEKL